MHNTRRLALDGDRNEVATCPSPIFMSLCKAGHSAAQMRASKAPANQRLTAATCRRRFISCISSRLSDQHKEEVDTRD